MVDVIMAVDSVSSNLIHDLRPLITLLVWFLMNIISWLAFRQWMENRLTIRMRKGVSLHVYNSLMSCFMFHW
jgi:hypothetical protein